MQNSMKKVRNGAGEEEESIMTDYEKQRALRIKQNMERMKALNLPSIASFLNKEFCDKEIKSERKASRKATKDKDDDEDEYQPTSDDDDDDEAEEEEEEEEEDEEEQNKRAKRKKVVHSSKKTRASTSKCPPRDEEMGNDEEIDEDAALQKAIALSLGGIAESSYWTEGSMHGHKQSDRKETNVFSERKKLEIGTSKARGRKIKGNGRPKMSEDDVINYFFLIDEAGKGTITWRDMKKAMVAHDFHWTDKEINDMIYFFDSKGKGNLNLEDFQRIVERCGMIQHAEYG